jgi:FeS assembly SUF system regulator
MDNVAMLRISKLADYSTVIVSALALEPKRLYSAKALADQVHIAVPTVSKLLKLMLNAGIVSSVRGVGGGYQLAAAPRDITIAQVVAAIEGKPALTECSLHAGSCVQDSVCAIKSNWRMINQIVISARHVKSFDA